MNKNIIVLIILCFCFYNTTIFAQEIMKNTNYSAQLGAVVFTPLNNNITQEGQIPIVELGQKLNIRFDILNGDLEDYLARILHCSRDWNISDLEPISYLTDFNEYRIENKTASINTITDYIHYNFTLPVVQVSGNYIIEVYHENNEDSIVLRRRFMVFKQQISISTTLKKGISSLNSAEKQQFEIQINYSNVNINNVDEEQHLCIIKNNDWNTIKWLGKPQFNKLTESIIVYDPYDENALFYAGNEYRNFDIRSAEYNRQNVRSIKENDNGIEAWLELVEISDRNAYTELVDLNGAFIISTDDNSKDPDIEGDYFDVHFRIKQKKTNDKPTYLIGDFTVGMEKSKLKMSYDSNQKTLTSKVRLKQGFYNYSVVDITQIPLDGNHFSTQNIYHFISYVSMPQNGYDEIIGYKRFDTRNN